MDCWPPASRRRLIASFVVAALLFAPIFAFSTLAESPSATDPLPSWNDGKAKQAIIDFVNATTDSSSPNFVPPEKRIATFDQDGTLWVEHPMYTQVIYCLERVPALVKAKPELANVEPFKTVMSFLSGDRAAIEKLSLPDLEKIAAATLTGMTVDEFQAEAEKWVASAKDRRWKRAYTDLVYQPMLEVLSYLRANGFKTYIVTGAVRISSASIPIVCTAFHQSRWSALQVAPLTVTIKTASLF
jgi:haloacid dehalogenase-like hydrolase